MQITQSRPSVTICGHVLAATAPFSAGHVLNENEAAGLNRAVVDALRNSFSTHAKELTEAAEKASTAVDIAALQADFDKFISTYEFGARKAGAPPADPVDRIAYAIASEQVKAAIKAKGFKIGEGQGEVSKEKLATLVKTQAGKDSVRKEANRRIQAQSKISLDEIGL